MKKFLSILLALVLVLSLAACSTGGNTSEPESKPESSEAPDSSEETPVGREDGLPAYTGEPCELRFTWWGGDARAEKTQQVIDLFSEAYPEIKITGEPRPSDSYWDNLNTQIGGNNAPDIMQFGGNLPDFVARDVLLELDGYVGDLLQIESADKFDQSVLSTGTLNGHLYGVCLGTNALVMAYNKTMLENAGAEMPKDTMSWDDYKAYGESIKDKLPEGVFPFTDNSVNTANYFSYFLTQRGEELYTWEEVSKATEAGCLAWINLWEDWRDAGLIPDIQTTAGYADTAVDNSIMVAGKAAFDLIWSNQLGTYQDAMTDTLALTQLPTGENNALAIQVSQYLAINKNTPNPEACALFINFFVTNLEAGTILGNDRGISSCPAVREEIAKTANDVDKQIYGYYDVAASRTVPQLPNLPNDQEFVDNLKIIGQQVSFGELTREQGAKDLYDLIQRLMVK